MKKIQIKKIGPSSAFKASIYLTLIPIALIVLIGIISLIIGIATGTDELTIFGVTYLIISGISLLLYGVIGLLSSMIYNWLAGKFGGLEIDIEEKIEPQFNQNYFQNFNPNENYHQNSNQNPSE